MRVEVKPLDLKTLLNAADLRVEYGLMVNHSLIASTALSTGLQIIATADHDFQRVQTLSVALPGDLQSHDA